MKIETRGIVVFLRPVYEADAFVTVFTKEYGKLTFLAKGVQKIQSKNRSSLELMTLSHFEIEVNEQTNKMKLIRATVLDGHIHLMDSFVQYGLACLIGQAFMQSFDDNQPNQSSFDALLVCVQMIANNDSIYYQTAKALMYLLQELGIEPKLDGCVHCGNTTQIIGFGIKTGGYVCRNCRFLDDLAHLNIEQSKMLRALKQGRKVEVDAMTLDVLVMFYMTHAQTKLSSYAVIKQML